MIKHICFVEHLVHVQLLHCCIIVSKIMVFNLVGQHWYLVSDSWAEHSMISFGRDAGHLLPAVSQFTHSRSGMDETIHRLPFWCHVCLWCFLRWSFSDTFCANPLPHSLHCSGLISKRKSGREREWVRQRQRQNNI